MTLGEKIREYRKKQKITQHELGAKLGISYMTLRRWEIGERQPNLEQIKKIAEILDAPLEDFIDVTLTQQAVQNIRPIRGGVVEVPVLGPQSSVCCGKGFDINDADTEIIRYELVPEEWGLGPRGDYSLYITYVEGDSMEPLLEEGGRILVNPNEEVTHGKIAVVAWNGYSMVRGVAFERNGDIRLRARNPSYSEILIQANDVEYVLKWCGVVKRFLGRDRPVTGFF